MARKPDSAFRSTSDAHPKLGVDATPRAGKRHGRRMRKTPSESRVEAVSPERIAQVADTFGSVEVTSVRRGKTRQYATMLRYIDPSRVRK